MSAASGARGAGAARIAGRLRHGAKRLRGRLRGRRHAPGDATAGLPFDDAELESRLVWILGSPRAGARPLLEGLAAPLALDGSQSSGLRLPSGEQGPLEVLPVEGFLLGTHLAPALGEPLDGDGGLLPATLNNYLGHKPAYLFARAFEGTWRPALRRLVLVRLFGLTARARDDGLPLAPAPTVLVEELEGSHAADLVMSLFPRARLLYLVQDGLAALESRLAGLARGEWLAGHGHGPSFGSAGERLAWVRGAARDWCCAVDATSRAYEAHPAGLRLKLRAEDLDRDGAAALRPVRDWLGLEDARPAPPAGGRRSPHGGEASPDGHGTESRAGPSARLTAAERRAALEVMGGRLAELGYR